MQKEDLDSSQIEELKREIRELREKSEAGDAQGLQEGLQSAIERLIMIFEKGAEYVKQDSASEVIGNVQQISRGVARLLEENAVIAKGLIKLTGAVQGLAQKVTGIELSTKEAPDMPSEAKEQEQEVIPRNPKHHLRKRALDKYKEEFSK